MDIASKDNFPHIYQLEQLGGDKSAGGEKYYEEHEKELSDEFSSIMRTLINREKFGTNIEIHKIDEKEKEK